MTAREAELRAAVARVHAALETLDRVGDTDLLLGDSYVTRVPLLLREARTRLCEAHELLERVADGARAWAAGEVCPQHLTRRKIGLNDEPFCDACFDATRGRLGNVTTGG